MIKDINSCSLDTLLLKEAMAHIEQILVLARLEHVQIDFRDTTLDRKSLALGDFVDIAFFNKHHDRTSRFRKLAGDLIAQYRTHDNAVRSGRVFICVQIALVCIFLNRGHVPKLPDSISGLHLIGWLEFYIR
ncbi:hypothetical protein D3260_06600 [Salinisphaera sp. Q1T1-3]|nr:hypothetical protein D3260_06600 [Salinisphaera sp. Q1T1-3]